ELPAALIAGQALVPISRHFERVPGDQHGARLLGLVDPQQEIGEAEQRARRTLLARQDRLRQRVIGAPRERVAVDHRQRPAALAFAGALARVLARVLARWCGGRRLPGARRARALAGARRAGVIRENDPGRRVIARIALAADVAVDA